MRYRARTALVILVAILVSAFPALAATPIASTAINYEIDIDGSFSEWDGMPVVYLDESIRLFAVAHDDQDIYLMFRFSDRQLARQIMHRGVMIWFNGDGKTKNKKEKFGVRYPGSPEIASELASEGQSERPGSGGQGSGRTAGGPPPPGRAEMRPTPGELTVIRNGIKEEILAEADDAIGAGSAIFEEVFTYELRIPFSEIGGKVGSTDPSQKRKLAIGIQIGGLTRAEREMLQSAMKERMGDMGGMGSMGGSKGGGMGGMGGAGGMGGMGAPGSMGGGQGGGGMGGGTGGNGRMPADMDPEIQWLTVTLPAPG